MVLLDYVYYGLFPRSQYALETHVKNSYVSRDCKLILVLPKTEKSQKQQSCPRELLNKLDQSRFDWVEDVDSRGKVIDTFLRSFKT